MPIGPADVVCFAQKVALREVNSHSIVNATTRLALIQTEGEDAAPRFGACHIVFGGRVFFDPIDVDVCVEGRAQPRC